MAAKDDVIHRHAVLHRTIFSKMHEELLTSIMVYAVDDEVKTGMAMATSMATSMFKGAKSADTKFVLCLTVSTNNKDTKDGFGAPKMHRVKVKGGDVYHLKKTRMLKAVSSIECKESKDGREKPFTVSFRGHRPYSFTPMDGATRPQFVWWLIEACRIYHQFVPPTNLDTMVLKTITQEMTAQLGEEGKDGAKLNGVQRHLVAALDKAKASGALEDNQGLADAGMELPAITIDEAMDVQHYLNQAELDISSIHKLEKHLLRHLATIENENIRELFEAQSRTGDLLNKLDFSLTKLEETEMWINHHDNELAKMRAGIDRIESRNQKLEVQERNHNSLYRVLRNTVMDISLKPDVETTLTTPDFKNNLRGALAAARELDTAIRLQLEGGLEELKAVKDQRANFDVLKAKFLQGARSALEQAFVELAREQANALRESDPSLDIPRTEIHDVLREYLSLCKYLERLDARVLAELRPKYYANFSKYYETKLKGYFAGVKRLVLPESKDTRMQAFPDYVLSTGRRPSASNLAAATPSARNAGKTVSKDLFADALRAIGPLCTAEQKFLIDFFGGTPPPSEDTAASPSSTVRSPSAATPTAASSSASTPAKAASLATAPAPSPSSTTTAAKKAAATRKDDSDSEEEEEEDDDEPTTRAPAKTTGVAAKVATPAAASSASSAAAQVAAAMAASMSNDGKLETKVTTAPVAATTLDRRNSSSSLASEPATPKPRSPWQIETRRFVQDMMSVLFRGLDLDLKHLCDLGDKADHFYSLEMLVTTEGAIKTYGDCDYLFVIFTVVTNHLQLLFNGFIDEELRWIEGAKAGKYEGVLKPIAKFPSFVDRMELSMQGAGRSRSTAADSAYSKLTVSLFKWLDGVAAEDKKHADLVYVENCHFLSRALRERNPAIASLEPSITKSRVLYNEHLAKYVVWQIEYEFEDLCKFWNKIEDELKAQNGEFKQVQFVTGINRHDLRKLDKDHLSAKAVAKNVSGMYARLKKHMAKNSLLLKDVWRNVKETFTSKWERFEKLVAEVYQNEALTANRDQFVKLLDAEDE